MTTIWLHKRGIFITFLSADCQTPQPPVNGNFSGTSYHGGYITVVCDAGYEVPDNSASVFYCINGAFNGTMSQCQGKITTCNIINQLIRIMHLSFMKNRTGIVPGLSMKYIMHVWKLLQNIPRKLYECKICNCSCNSSV